jgi:hypothetical protein
MMMARSARTLLLRGLDVLPWAVGATLLWMGLQGNPAVSLAGSLVLTVAGLSFFASVHGYAVPRPGLLRIATLGCGDPPIAFHVRHRGRGLLFHPPTVDTYAGPAENYCVVAVPHDWPGGAQAFGPWEPPEDSRLLGLVPASDLRFEYGGGPYVDRSSLDAVLRRIDS